MSDIIVCPKCGNKDITCFERDFYIVRDEIDFVKRKIYGCKKCEIMFAYDTTHNKKTTDTKISNIQSAFSKIAKQCENVTNNISIK